VYLLFGLDGLLGLGDGESLVVVLEFASLKCLFDTVNLDLQRQLALLPLAKATNVLVSQSNQRWLSIDDSAQQPITIIGKQAIVVSKAPRARYKSAATIP
jgi:hypothetical protein